MIRKKLPVFILVILSIVSLAASVFAVVDVSKVSEKEMEFLRMYFTDEELGIVSSTRSLKSISRVAENVEVVTADDIELMNAHTLADVLNTVNGLLVTFVGGSPGNSAAVSIQGSDVLRHVAVFMDGIPLNNLANNVTDIGFIPVQHIEKIEIIKGPASSAWGSSLGGVINIITKGPTEKTGGTLSASYGERETGDFRAELSGKKNRFGFYVAAGRLRTDGFRTNTDVSNNNLYTKFSLDLAEKTKMLLTLFYGEDKKGNWRDPDFGDYDRMKDKQLWSGLSLNTVLSREAALDVSAWSFYKQEKHFYYPGDGSKIDNGTNQDNKYGASGKFTWNYGNHSVVIGSDYETGMLRSDIIVDGKQEREKWAVYANDTIAIGRLSVTPGIRYDATGINDDFVSPSLGITYALGEKTIVRGYVARGFSVPPFNFTDLVFLKSNPDLKVEKVTSYQLGIETGVLEYVWLKISAFRHDLKDGLVSVSDGVDTWYVNQDKLRKQGIEIEMKTRPVYNTTLFAGAMFLDAENRDTGEKLSDVPEYAYKIGLKYEDEKSFRALLQGNYYWYRSSDVTIFQPDYNSFIFDLNISKAVYQRNESSLDIFLTGHNIFNGSQYIDFWYKNASRWFEAGLRYKF